MKGNKKQTTAAAVVYISAVIKMKKKLKRVNSGRELNNDWL